MLLVYVDDCLVVSHAADAVMRAIGKEFEIKDGKWGPPEFYLGAGVEQFTVKGEKYWSMRSDKYVKNAVQTVKGLLKEDGRELKGGKRHHAGPLPTGYKPELDVTRECDEEHASRFRQIIGILRWAVELGRLDILLEVSIMSQFQANPREGHLEALYLIVFYLHKNPMKRMVFDPRKPRVDEQYFNTGADWKEFYGDIEEEDPPHMPEPLGRSVRMSCFVDANHAGNVITRRSHTGILIMLNNAPIIAFSKRQNTVESATCGSELVEQ